ncbi:MAG: hypothetical protein FJ149_08390 [Euryarchaeota archaeon]|nr:hypothetical protein [Euryarchaeota archaeon]
MYKGARQQGSKAAGEQGAKGTDGRGDRVQGAGTEAGCRVLGRKQGAGCGMRACLLRPEAAPERSVPALPRRFFLSYHIESLSNLPFDKLESCTKRSMRDLLECFFLARIALKKERSGPGRITLRVKRAARDTLPLFSESEERPLYRIGRSSSRIRLPPIGEMG